MNRNFKRLMAARASKIGSEMARTCLDYSATGALVRVENPGAVASLERAFVTLLRGGCEPLAMPITAEAARAFPRKQTVEPGADAWLVVGLDGQDCGTYALRFLTIVANDPATVRHIAELAMLSELACETAQNGIPVGRAMGWA